MVKWILLTACLFLFRVHANYDILGGIMEQGTSFNDKAIAVCASVDGFVFVVGFTGGSLNRQPSAGQELALLLRP